MEKRNVGSINVDFADVSRLVCSSVLRKNDAPVLVLQDERRDDNVSKEKGIMQRLAAKSFDREKYSDAPDQALLSTHLRLTYAAAKAIFELTANRQLEVCGLNPNEYRARFQRIFLLAAAIHDLGKANSLFQKSVRGEPGQSLRHEWVLYVLLRFSPLGIWIKNAFPKETRDTDFTFLVWATTGHHRKNQGEEALDSGQYMELSTDSDDFRAILAWLVEQDELGLAAPDFDPSALAQAIWDKENGETIGVFFQKPGSLQADELRNKVCRAEPNDEKRDEFEDDVPMMAAIRSSLMAADVAASAAGDAENGFAPGNEESQMFAWIQERLGALPKAEDFQKIVDLKRTALPSQATELAQARSIFQNQVANSPNRVTLCVAGCGSGKTLAAWLWAVENCGAQGDRLFFCYPTTGTATEGFLDYLVEESSTEEGKRQFQAIGSLFHSRSDADDRLFEKLSKIKNAEKRASNAVEADAIMKSLRIWGTPIVCCTVDVVLKFLVGSYSGCLSWPALSQALFVFDEIHSYDETLFVRLLEFLKIARGANILLMTASLPKARLKRLQSVLRKSGGLGVVNGPTSWERIKRYRRLRSEQTPIEIALEQFRAGKKVLWVCNTVGRAIDAARRLRDQFGEETRERLIVYHSHFKYKDRVKRHQETIQAFKGEKPVLCVATQVAEMSLDVSADFLLADAAPIPALIQRLGRLNRRATDDDARPFFIVEPRNDRGEIVQRPYEDDWFETTQKWLERLGDAPLSQIDLTEKWAELEENRQKNKNDETSPWIDAGPWMRETNLRDLSPKCEVLLSDDVAKVKFGGRTAFVENVIPMNERKDKKAALTPWPKYGCYIDATGKAVRYDADLGGFWIDENENDGDESPKGVKEILVF